MLSHLARFKAERAVALPHLHMLYAQAREQLVRDWASGGKSFKITHQ